MSIKVKREFPLATLYPCEVVFCIGPELAEGSAASFLTRQIVYAEYYILI